MSFGLRSLITGRLKRPSSAKRRPVSKRFKRAMKRGGFRR